MEKKFTVLNKEIIVDDKMQCYIDLQKKKMELRELALEMIDDIFAESDTIEGLLNTISGIITKLNDILIDSSVNILLDKGIFTIDAELYFEKYYSDYFDCSEVISPLVEKYLQITRTEEELENYRNYLKASRKRWRGGGFGIKGAIKGAISAEILNIGTDFIHSLGDHTKKVNDEYAIKKLKSELLSDTETKNILECAMITLIDGWFCSLINELSEQDVLNRPAYDTDSAKAIVNNLNKRADRLSVEKILDLLREAFIKDPFYYPLYEIILSTDLIEVDDNLEFIDYIGFKQIYDQEQERREEELQLYNKMIFESEIQELCEKGEQLYSCEGFSELLESYMELQEKSGLDLHQDIEKALLNQFKYMEFDEIEEIERLCNKYSKKMKNVDFDGALGILENRKKLVRWI